MPPKKKASKKKAKNEGKKESVAEFLKVLKGMQKAAELISYPVIDQIVSKINEGTVPAFIFTGVVDLVHFKIFCDALLESKFDLVKSIRLVDCGEYTDACVRYLCPYLSAKKFTCKVEELHITNSHISNESLNMLATSLKTNESINMLRLDYCKIKSSGFELLSSGIACNQYLRSLSLQYCDLDHTSATNFSRILLYIDTHLEELNLRGNLLGLAGVLEILSVGCRKAKHLRYVNFSDNRLTDSPELLDAMAAVMRSRTNIERYSLSGNLLTDTTANPLVTLLTTASHIKSLTLPTSCSTNTLKLLQTTLAGGKPKKKGKKGKKKAKK